MIGMISITPTLEAEMQEKLYTVTELTEVFDRSRQTIHTWIGDGRFPNFITVGGNNQVLVPASDVEAVKKEEAERLIAELNRLGFQTVSA